ncbi:MAG: hypothetical protein K2M64_00960 [Clostridia bacterium]|nr:hypothetical protein [Clostridia bacterium]
MATIKKNTYSTTRSASKTTLLALFCILFIILCALSYVCFFSFFNEKHFQQMIDDGIVAKAEIYSCGQDNIRSPYACAYKYVDENGTEYIGVLKPIYKTKQEAEAHIGETIEIYIDGKGKSIPVGEEPQVEYSLVWVVISTVLVCADIVGIVIVSIKIRQSLKHC